MPLILGALTLQRVESFGRVKAISYPRKHILGASAGKIDDDAKTWEPNSYRLVALLNNTDMETLDGYVDSYRTISDADSGFSESIKVEKVDADYVVGHDFNSDFCWRVRVEMVLSNS